MKLNFDSGIPIFCQLAGVIEDDILADVYKADEMISSTNQMAQFFGINPATAVKGVSILTDSGVLYKKRGIGMCVSPQAKELILERRRQEFFAEKLPALLDEARKLGIGKARLIEKIEEIEEA